ncbi:MAG: carboxylesterase family protein [Planctomycetota bacterium]|nr:carboxylesterase family protein [Planctomycetota bacterium]
MTWRINFRRPPAGGPAPAGCELPQREVGTNRRMMERVSAPAFQYSFTRASQSYPALGAPHAIELAYVFNTLKADRAWKGGRELARKLMKYWVRFAETRNPNSEDLPAWPEYDSKKSSYLELGDELKTGAGLGKRTCGALDRFTSRADSTMEAED